VNTSGSTLTAAEATGDIADIEIRTERRPPMKFTALFCRTGCRGNPETDDPTV
jgi:hypothetical protein